MDTDKLIDKMINNKNVDVTSVSDDECDNWYESDEYKDAFLDEHYSNDNDDAECEFDISIFDVGLDDNDDSEYESDLESELVEEEKSETILHCGFCSDDRSQFGPFNGGVIVSHTFDGLSDSDIGKKNKDLTGIISAGCLSLVSAINASDCGVVAPHVLSKNVSKSCPDDLVILSDFRCGWINNKDQVVYPHGVMVDLPVYRGAGRNISHIFNVPFGIRVYPVTFSDGNQCVVWFDRGNANVLKATGLLGVTYIYRRGWWYSEFKHSVLINGNEVQVYSYSEFDDRDTWTQFVVVDGMIYQRRKNNYLILQCEKGICYTSDKVDLGYCNDDGVNGIFKVCIKDSQVVIISELAEDTRVDSIFMVDMIKAQPKYLPYIGVNSHVKPRTMTKSKFCKHVWKYYSPGSFDYSGMIEGLWIGRYQYDNYCFLRTMLSFGIIYLKGVCVPINMKVVMWHCPRARWEHTLCLCLGKYYTYRSADKLMKEKYRCSYDTIVEASDYNDCLRSRVLRDIEFDKVSDINRLYMLRDFIYWLKSRKKDEVMEIENDNVV